MAGVSDLILGLRPLRNGESEGRGSREFLFLLGPGSQGLCLLCMSSPS